jgi:hypothetical protein
VAAAARTRRGTTRPHHGRHAQQLRRHVGQRAHTLADALGQVPQDRRADPGAQDPRTTHQDEGHAARTLQHALLLRLGSRQVSQQARDQLPGLLRPEWTEGVVLRQAHLGQVGQHAGEGVLRPHLGMPVGPDHP